MAARKLALGFTVSFLSLWCCTGCAELFAFFGPGGIFGPDSTTDSSQTQPTIASPSYSVSQLDPALEATSGAKVVVTADMDGDGLTDLVSGSDENQPIQLHMRSATSTSFETMTIAGGSPIARMTDLAVDDFDGDGNPDVAVLVHDTETLPVSGAIVLLFAPEDPRDVLAWDLVTIDLTLTFPMGGSGFTDFAVADMNGDGWPDIVLASNEDASTDVIRLLINPGAGASRDGATWTQSTLPLTQDVNEVVAIKVFDVDGDGDLDVVGSFPTAATHNIRWLKNPLNESDAAAVAAGAWEEHFLGEQAEADPDNQGGDFIAAGDIDGDGDIDIVAAHKALGLIQWFENPGPSIVGKQTFPWNVFNLGKLDAGMDINQLQVVDLNLDGKLDAFVTANGEMFGFQSGIQRNDFWSRFLIVGTDPIADIGRCSFFDVNGDGRTDIIAPINRLGLDTDEFLIFTRSGL